MPSRRSTAPSDGDDWFLVNRVADQFRRALRSHAPALGRRKERIFFTYFAERDADTLDVSALPPSDRLYRLAERRALHSVSDKRRLAERIAYVGARHIAPLTCFSREQALEREDVTHWYRKVATSTGGKGMRVLRREELPELAEEDTRAIIYQEAVRDVLLLDGRKFTARVYVLAWNGGLYLFDDGLIVIHGAPYDPDSTDYTVQIDHRGYADAASPVGIEPLRSYQRYPDFRPALIDLMEAMVPVLRPCLRHTDELRYALLGIDLLLRPSGTATLLEVNAVPNFRHTLAVNKRVNTPFLREATGLMFGIPSTRMTRIVPPARLPRRG